MSFLDRLIGGGVLYSTGVDGLYGRSETFERVLEAVDAWATRHGASARPERVRFPPVLPREQFERSEYLKGFPQLAGAIRCFCGDEKAHRELMKDVEAGEDWTAKLEASDIVLTPAACYPIYPLLASRGALPRDGKLMDVMSWCFRREPSLQPTRMQLFRMREYVRVAEPDDIAAFRQAWMDKAPGMVDALGLPFTVDVANDPFFGRPGKLKADNQRAQALKFELLIPVNDGDDPTACISFNYHQDHFGHIWDIRTAQGATAHSGCVAFGLERLTLALLRHHGLDPTAWPPTVQRTLWP